MLNKKKESTEAKKKASVRCDNTGLLSRIFGILLLALGLVIVSEFCNRGLNTMRVLTFVIKHPLFFLYNVLIVGTTLTFSELFRRRRAVLMLVSILWLAASVGNLIVINSRTQPFVSMDMFMVGDAIKLTTIYYTWPQIIAMYGGLFVAVACMIYAMTRLPVRRKVNHFGSFTIFSGLTILCICLCTIGLSLGVFPQYYDNMIEAYDKFGFATCFTFTFGNMGVARPSDYSEQTVNEILSDIEATPEMPKPRVFTADDDLSRPNIIYVQLESFFNPNTIVGAKYDTDPIPNFNTLCRECPSGELYMSSVGGGTANSEFEMLTGFSLDFFGPGEYPFSTVLKEKNCESIAYELKKSDYVSTGMHNNTGTFYSRTEVYGRMGFDRFVPLEYMPYVTYTDIGWAEDIILKDEIMKAMRSTEERDFVMAITVESHGKYADTYSYTDGDPVPLQYPEQLNEAQFKNYLHLIHETDKFIGALIEELSMYEEPVVCVFYGDHLPSLNLTSDIIANGNVYASRYVIWNNYGAKFDAPDMQAYRFNANLLRQLELPGGIITRFHEGYAPDCTDENYMAKLKTLEYDLLYGDGTSYEGGKAPENVDMKMGSVPIQISGATNQYGRVLVTGQNFTEYSNILLDDELYPTAFVSSAQLVCVVPRNTKVEHVTVAQIASDGTELGRTLPYAMDAEANYNIPKLISADEYRKSEEDDR